MVDLAGRPITFHIVRKDGSDTTITVQPAYRTDLGVRMQMGKVAAVRAGSPADGQVRAVPVDGPPTAPGDQIAAVGVTDPAGKRVWYASGPRPAEARPDDEVRPLDPVLLPLQLKKWAAEFPADRRKGLKVDLVVMRLGEGEHEAKRKPLTLDYDDSYRYERDVLLLPNSPLPADGLGLAYWVEAQVLDVAPGSPAADKLKQNDVIEAVRLKGKDAKGEVKAGDWREIKPHQWAHAEAVFQGQALHEIDVRVKRADKVEEVTLTGREDTAWPTDDRGLVLEHDFRVHQAADFGDAVNLGVRRTGRFIKEVYMTFYSMVRGRISPLTMSGPLSIATASYRIAGEDVWQFLLFLALISVNLAVVNFLPIPVLDGGHMVFLIYEWVTGRPVPERLFAALMWVGLILILLLFLFVIGLDIQRLFF
jgi:regulator of sigma E protease